MSEPQIEIRFPSGPRALLTPREIYEAASETLLRELGEDNRLEYKASAIHCKELGEYFSMWGNTPPTGGLIVVGVRNTTIWEGCSSLSQEQLNNLESTGHTYASDAVHESKRIAIHRDSDGKEDFLVVFYVKYHPSKVVRTSSNKVYVRRADSIHQLKHEEIALLQEQKGEVSFERDPCGLAYPDAFHVDRIKEFVEEVRARRGYDASHSVESILELQHLGRSDRGKFVPNRACALLFSRDPRELVPGCRIRFLRFEGEKVETGKAWNAVKDEFVDGAIPEQIEGAASILRSQLRTFSRLEKKGQFSALPEYPEDAWYEAIVNACVHRSYSNGMKNIPIDVRMFDDRLVVESPGPFMPFVTPATIGESHSPRNPFLMEAMFYMRFVKMAREGVQRMRVEMVKMGLPTPEFAQEDVAHTFVRVTLRNNAKQRKEWVDADVAGVLGQGIAASLSEDEKRIINYLAQYGTITISHAARITNRDWATAARMLKRLDDARIVRRVARRGKDRDPKAHYVLAHR